MSLQNDIKEKRDNSEFPYILVETEPYSIPPEIETYFQHYLEDTKLKLFFSPNDFNIAIEYYGDETMILTRLNKDLIDDAGSTIGQLRDNPGTEIRNFEITFKEAHFPILFFLQSFALEAIANRAFIEISIVTHTETFNFLGLIQAPFIFKAAIKTWGFLYNWGLEQWERSITNCLTEPVSIKIIERVDRYRFIYFPEHELRIFIKPDDYSQEIEGDGPKLEWGFNETYISMSLLRKGFTVKSKDNRPSIYQKVLSIAEDALFSGKPLNIEDNLEPNGIMNKTGFIMSVRPLGGLENNTYHNYIIKTIQTEYNEAAYIQGGFEFKFIEVDGRLI